MRMVRGARFVAVVAVVLAAAIVVGTAVAMAVALLGHEVLVLRYGEDLNVIDDTLPMHLAVGTAYLAGAGSGLAVLVLGWRHLVRRSTGGRRRDAE